MLKPARYYLAGLAVALAALVAAELIWLPAPLKTASGMQWIEMIDWLFNLLALAPLSFAIGALLGLFRHGGWRGLSILLQLLRLVIAGLGLIGAGYVLFAPEKLFLLLVLIGAAVPLVFADMFISEILHRVRAGKAYNSGMQQGRRGKRSRKALKWLPKRSIAALLVTVVLILALVCPTGYQVTYPGMTLNMNRYAHVESGAQGARSTVFSCSTDQLCRLIGCMRSCCPCTALRKYPRMSPRLQNRMHRSF